jgi:predicted N-acetyltransferase YhbS
MITIRPERAEDYTVIHEINVITYGRENEASTLPCTHGRSSEILNQGIVSKLVSQGLECCRNRGHKIVVIVDHPQYYPRFGLSAS